MNTLYVASFYWSIQHRSFTKVSSYFHGNSFLSSLIKEIIETNFQDHVEISRESWSDSSLLWNIFESRLMLSQSSNFGIDLSRNTSLSLHTSFSIKDIFHQVKLKSQKTSGRIYFALPKIEMKCSVFSRSLNEILSVFATLKVNRDENASHMNECENVTWSSASPVRN